jgi:hypothetical protein
MRDERPTNGNNATPSPESPQNKDWREQRRERRHQDPLRSLFWGLMLILVGVIFLLNQWSETGWDTLWKYLLIGLGAIFIIDGLAHYWNPAYRYMGLGRFVPGIVLIFVGVAFLYNFTQWWPIVLIALGIIILFSFLFRRR